MTQNTFKKAAIFGDIHYGIRHNSRTHNEDCEDYLKWMVDQAKQAGCETCIFLGDFHHHRASVNVSTLNYIVRGLRILNNSFEKTYFLVGNHDLFYRERREVHSIPMVEEFQNIQLIDEITTIGDITLVPWLVNDEWKQMKKIKSRYVFGHFEIPHFKMNALVEMPDHGELQSEHFANREYVFSGHFHKRQFKNNIHYVGSPFGHNYADAWDDDRGFAILEWGGKPEYVVYENGPKYISTTLSKLMENTEQYLKPKTYAKVMLDVDITYEEANFLRETYMNDYDIREIKLVPVQKELEEQDFSGDIKFQSVDQIVLDHLVEINSDSFDKQRLIQIYNELNA